MHRGANIHPWNGLGAVTQYLDYLHASGCDFVRADLYWSAFQPAQGAPLDNGQVALAQGIVDAATARNIQTSLMLAGTPAWSNAASQTAPPANPDDYAAFIRAFVLALGHRKYTLEVWNEPNIDFGAGTWEPATYVALLKAAYTAAKVANPALQVSMAGIGTNDQFYIKALVAAGLLQWTDLFNVHPYPYGGAPAVGPFAPDDTSNEQFSFVQSILDARSYGKPVLLGEWGYYANTMPDAAMRAACTGRAVQIASALGVYALAVYAIGGEDTGADKRGTLEWTAYCT